jgi:hypothetical protein
LEAPKASGTLSVIASARDHEESNMNRPTRHVPAIALSLLTSVGLAQSVRTQGDTGWVLNTGATAPYFLHTRTGTGALASNNPQEFHAVVKQPTEIGGLVRAGISGKIFQDGDNTADQAIYSIRYDRTFKLLDNADISLANWFSARLSFTGNNNTNTAAAFATIVVSREKTAGAGDWEQVGQTAEVRIDAAGANKEVLDKLRVTTTSLAADANRRYFVRAEVYSTQASTPGSPNATSAGSNSFGFGGDRKGFAASFALTPTNFNVNSRDLVGLTAARAKFNLDGTGIKIGMIEPGNPYTAAKIHTDMDERIAVANGNVAGNYADEHATAVAGIMISASAQADRAGVASNASIISNAMGGETDWSDGVNRLYQQGARVINMSATGTSPFTYTVNGFLARNPNLTLVAAAGNDGAPPANGNVSTVGSPASQANVIAVGALNRDGTRRADFSSYNRSPSAAKPDLVAPGEYILSTSSGDNDGDGSRRDYARFFTGGDYDHQDGRPATGEISGTSFAAPFVSGTVALMQEYAATKHDARSIDSRVVRAVLLNQARTDVKRSNGDAWSPIAGLVNLPSGGQAWGVSKSLDSELGAGRLDIDNTLRLYTTAEARAADNAEGQNFKINFANNGTPKAALAWDLQQINAPTAEAISTVDYLIGALPASTPFRTTLAFHQQQTLINNSLQFFTPVLNLILFREGAQNGNTPGYDPAKPDDDTIVAFTNESATTVRLIDLLLDTPGKYYLQVRNSQLPPGGILGGLFTAQVDFGIAWTIPTPGTLGLLAISGILSTRRRRS